jgi:aryl-alcohol dehydrogenase-like predicted oxidoreductase
MTPSGFSIDPSRVVVGTLGFGSQVEEPVAHRILASAYERGIATIDLAPGYGEGRARSVVRNYLSQNPGQHWRVWDKIGMRMSFTGGQPGFERSFPGSSARMVEEIKHILDRLKIDYLDALQIHLPLDFGRESYVLEGIFGSIDLGLVRSFGCCNHEVGELAMLSQKSRAYGHSLAHSQVQVSLIEQRATTALIPMCQSEGAKVVANRVFARGLITHEDLDNSKRVRASRRTKKYMINRQAAIHTLREVIREKTSIGFPELALRWVLGPGSADLAVVGFSDETQVDSALGKGEDILDEGFWSDVLEDDRLRGQDFGLYPATFFDTR